MFIHILLLVCALCIDSFAAGIAYGSNQVKLTAPQIAAASGICSLCLGLSLLFGNVLDSWIPETFTRAICLCSLLLLGMFKLSDSAVRHYLRRHTRLHKDIRFSLSHLRFIVSIYADPLEADADGNKVLSWREVVFFSFAMSIDSLISGTMAAFLKIPVLLTLFTAFIAGVVFLSSGLLIGRRISARVPADLSWLSGTLFIVLAILKL